METSVARIKMVHREVEVGKTSGTSRAESIGALWFSDLDSQEVHGLGRLKFGIVIDSPPFDTVVVLSE